jgi:hypothetical protein
MSLPAQGALTRGHSRARAAAASGAASGPRGQRVAEADVARTRVAGLGRRGFLQVRAQAAVVHAEPERRHAEDCAGLGANAARLTAIEKHRHTNNAVRGRFSEGEAWIWGWLFS